MNPQWKQIKDADLHFADRSAVVYLAVFDGVVKIGTSIQPYQRIKTIEKSSGRKLIDAYILTASGPYVAHSAKARLHKQFDHCRLQREFFSVIPALVMEVDLDLEPFDTVAHRLRNKEKADAVLKSINAHVALEQAQLNGQISPRIRVAMDASEFGRAGGIIMMMEMLQDEFSSRELDRSRLGDVVEAAFARMGDEPLVLNDVRQAIGKSY